MPEPSASIWTRDTRNITRGIDSPFKTSTVAGYSEPDDDDIREKLDDILERLEKLEAKSRPSIIVTPTDQEIKFYGSKFSNVLSVL